MANPKRFTIPIEVARPRNAHRLEGYSPKLQRRLRLYDRAGFEWWLRLESDAEVIAFCERPGHVRLNEVNTLIDFWVCYANREEVHLISLDAPSVAVPRKVEFGVGEEANVRVIRREDVLALRTWIFNWEHMLPYLTASRGMVLPNLRAEVLEHLSTGKQLSTIERELSSVDAMLVRAAVFGLLHEGKLCAPSLYEQALSARTRFSLAR